jgi:hypothetical protein
MKPGMKNLINILGWYNTMKIVENPHEEFQARVSGIKNFMNGE